MSARFQQDWKIEVERNNLPNSEAQVLRSTGGIPSRPYAFLVLSSVRAEITSLEEITILSINELEGVEGGGIAPEMSKVEVERQRRNSLPRQGASSETQVLRTTGGILSGPYAFLVLSLERAEITSLEDIIILGINELEGVEGGGIASGPYAFLVLSSERAEITSLEEILILGINELEGAEGGGIAPELSKVELEAKV